MRRFALSATFLIGILVLIIVACNGEDETTPAKSPTPTESITPTTTLSTLPPTTTVVTPPATDATTPDIPTPTLTPTQNQDGMIIDHHVITSLFRSGSLDLSMIPDYWINQAKNNLHIAYGHTSHGSQLTTGMTGLMEWKGDLYAWNEGGTGGALDLQEGDAYGDGPLDHDCGYYPDWVDETREYLDSPANSDINVIIWAWCGQVSSRTQQSMITRYLDPMTQLEIDYPDITFVYMTGHADGTGLSGNLHIRNQQIRDYCEANNKVLYDFYDIECYDPNGNYFGDKNVNDNCDYDGGNWANEWQNSHTEDVDWYECESAHSQTLNANQKTYAAWWMFARLAGWDGE